jgi:general secretion pathway protein G
MRARGGFTLIELMIVVIIIAALAGMVVPRLIGRSDEMKSRIVEGDLATLSTALKLFRLDNDRYPSSQEGLRALLTRPASAKNWSEPYIEDEPLDPWDQPYQYSHPGTRNKNGFDIFSIGVDGETGSDDDVGNWKK